MYKGGDTFATASQKSTLLFLSKAALLPRQAAAPPETTQKAQASNSAPSAKTSAPILILLNKNTTASVHTPSVLRWLFQFRISFG